MASKRFFSKTRLETRRIARLIARDLCASPHSSGALAVGFSGELGAGKTTIIQAIGEALGVRRKMQSPTFVFMKKYDLPRRALRWKTLFHVDAYRISKKREVSALGLQEALSDSRNIVFIEWAEKIKKILPKNTIWIEMRHKGGSHRHILVR